MTDKQQGTRVVEHVGFQPDNGLNIEVIGRFIQQQHIRLNNQRTRQHHSPSPAAGKRMKDGITVKLKPRQHALDTLFQLPAISRFQVML